jgi:uncharacterized protein (TIGR02270 family)
MRTNTPGHVADGNRVPSGRRIVPELVRQHAEDAAVVHAGRTALTASPGASLRDLHRFDRRLAAHLDGLRIAGDQAWPFCCAALEPPSAGSLFTATVRAMETDQRHQLEMLNALARSMPGIDRGMRSAFGWLEPAQLQGRIPELLDGGDGFQRVNGIAACALHRVHPGSACLRLLRDPEPAVRARALRAAGELGLGDLRSDCAAALTAEDDNSRTWAAWSMVLLGDREHALDSVARTGQLPGPLRWRAFRLALQALDIQAGHALLQRLASDVNELRSVIQGSGIVGDPAYVPWLIGHMAGDPVARLAGEAFALITGADIGTLELERDRPEHADAGPTDDPDDSNVSMDPDADLRWPDQRKVERWWAANNSRFRPGQRCFMGAPVTREHCIEVLKNGYQRQRIVAAHYLCLLEPGTPLFNTSAPAWRQQRLLAEMH